MKCWRNLAKASFLLILVIALGATGMSQEPGARESQNEPELVVPAGTNLPVALSTFLNSRSTQVGDTFYADTTYPIWIQQRLVIPRGSIVKGTVTKVVRPGKVKGKAQLAIRFDNILLPNGITRDLVAIFQGIHGPGEEKIDRQTETVEMDSSKGADAGQVAGPTGQGAIIGAVAGEGTGALIGGPPAGPWDLRRSCYRGAKSWFSNLEPNSTLYSNSRCALPTERLLFPITKSTAPHV
jgi:hypothetical protein